jgi:hypothetical protein
VPLNLQGGAPGEERLSVYREGYGARMRESLAETYEAVKFVLGEDRFTDMALDYSKKYHSRDYNLSVAGRHLPDYLKNSDYSKKLAFITDLARLEWAIAETFHAFQEPALGASDMAAVVQEKLLLSRLVFQKGVTIFSSEWPVLDIWNARKTDRKKVDIDLTGKPQTILIFRSGFQVRCELLEPWQAKLTIALMEGQNLEKACDVIADDLEDFSAVSVWFSKLMAEQMIVRCEDPR